MKIENVFQTLGIPLALVGVVVALLAWAGLSPDQLYIVAGGLIGVQMLGALVIDVLKYVGAVNAGSSGKWSAAIQLVVWFAIVVWFKLYPEFDIYGADAKLLEFVKVVAVVFAYITQLIGAKSAHVFLFRRVPGFRFNAA